MRAGPRVVAVGDGGRVGDAGARRRRRGRRRSGDSPFEFDGLRYVKDVDESKALSASDAPAVVIAASGMCEAGRVLHHLRAGVEDQQNTALIVGFQAQHTLGRRLVEGCRERGFPSAMIPKPGDRLTV